MDKSPWKRNIDAPFKTVSKSLVQLSPQERCNVGDDIASSIAAKATVEAWNTVCDLEGGTRDFVYVAQTISLDVMREHIKQLASADALTADHLTAAMLMTALTRKYIEWAAKQYKLEIDKDKIERMLRDVER